MATKKIETRWNSASVLEQAALLADEYGYESLSMASLAQHLGIKPPSLYKHVESLDELRVQLQNYAVQSLMKALQKAAVGRAGEDVIFAVAHAYRNFVLSHPGLHAAMNRPSGKRSQSGKEKELETSNENIVALGLQVLEPFKLDKKSSLHALRTLRSLIHGFATLEMSGGFAMDASIDESFNWAIKNFIKGL